jgi:hypothetical protein
VFSPVVSCAACLVPEFGNLLNDAMSTAATISVENYEIVIAFREFEIL